MWKSYKTYYNNTSNDEKLDVHWTVFQCAKTPDHNKNKDKYNKKTQNKKPYYLSKTGTGEHWKTLREINRIWNNFQKIRKTASETWVILSTILKCVKTP